MKLSQCFAGSMLCERRLLDKAVFTGIGTMRGLSFLTLIRTAHTGFSYIELLETAPVFVPPLLRKSNRRSHKSDRTKQHYETTFYIDHLGISVHVNGCARTASQDSTPAFSDGFSGSPVALGDHHVHLFRAFVKRVR